MWAILDGNTIVIDGSAGSLIYECNLKSFMLFKHTAVCWLGILKGDFFSLIWTDKQQHPASPISNTPSVPSEHQEMCKENSIFFLV